MKFIEDSNTYFKQRSIHEPYGRIWVRHVDEGSWSLYKDAESGVS